MEIKSLITLLGVMLFHATGACAVAGNLEMGTHAMTSEEIAKRYLQLANERYFEFGDQGRTDIIKRFSANREFSGLAISMPAELDLRQTESVPMVILGQKSAVRAWEISTRLNLAVFAVSRNTGEVYVGQAVYNEKFETMRKKPVRTKPPRPTGDAADALLTDVQIVNLLQRTPMPSIEDEYIVRALEFDWLSNAVTVKVNGPARSVAGSPELSRLDPAQFQKKASSPAPPRDGLVLHIPDRASPGVKSVRVSGAGRISLPDSATILREPAPEGARALVKGALVIAQKDDVPPIRFELVLPVFSSQPIKPGDVVDIFFEQDIGSQLEEPKAGSSYRVYWLMDRYISTVMPLEIKD